VTGDLAERLEGAVVNDLRAQLARAEARLEERESDMHVRIRQGYDRTVNDYRIKQFNADAWRAKVEQLEQQLTTTRQAFRWGYRALLRLAQWELAAANRDAEPGHWPAGQEWSDLGGSSKGAFLSLARSSADIPDEAFLAFVRTGAVSLEEEWDAAETWPMPRLEKT